jgi:hypothetical protein
MLLHHCTALASCQQCSCRCTTSTERAPSRESILMTVACVHGRKVKCVCKQQAVKHHGADLEIVHGDVALQ